MVLTEEKKVNNISHIVSARAAPGEIREMLRGDTRHLWPDLTGIALILFRGEAILIVTIFSLLEAVGIKGRQVVRCGSSHAAPRDLDGESLSTPVDSIEIKNVTICHGNFFRHLSTDQF